MQIENCAIGDIIDFNLGDNHHFAPETQLDQVFGVARENLLVVGALPSEAEAGHLQQILLLHR